MKTKDYTAVPLSLEKIEDFLFYMRKKQRSEATVRKYAADLKTFYYSLPEDKLLVPDTVATWRDSLLAAGFAVRTINSRIAACNSLLSFLKRKNWQVSPFPLNDVDSVPALSREEYYKLLETARQANKEMVYFLIKSFCCLGLSVGELPFLTVDSVVSGSVPVATKSRVRNIHIPEVLQDEFLRYVSRAKINSGAVFKSLSGEPFNRAFIMKELSALCRDAGIPEEKGTPQNLRELYLNTYSDIRATSSVLFDQAYSKILEEEHNIVNWDSVAT